MIKNANPKLKNLELAFGAPQPGLCLTILTTSKTTVSLGCLSELTILYKVMDNYRSPEIMCVKKFFLNNLETATQSKYVQGSETPN